MEPSVIATLNRYFRVRLGIANGVAYSGEGVGAMIMPLVMTATAETYTVRGTLLIFGGIWLNCCVLGALVRPPPKQRLQSEASDVKSSQSKPKSKPGQPQSANMTNDIVSIPEVITIKTNQNGSLKYQNSYKYSEIIRIPRLLRTIAILFCGGISSYGGLFVFPALSLEWGSTKFYSALTVSIAGVFEVVSKLAVGVLMDTKLLSKNTLLALLFLTAGLGAIITALVENKHALMGYAVVLGLTGMNFPTFAGPLLADCVPHQALGAAMGLYLFAYGCGISLGYPLIGEYQKLTKPLNRYFRI